jgi:acetyl esterase/lipase
MGRRFKSKLRATELPFTELDIPHLFNEENAKEEQRQREERDAAGEPLPQSSAPPLLVERWEELGGNFILRPQPGVPVRAVLHFLGGAFVGASPHVTYRYLLQGLADAGYLVVATPFSLGFDYLKTCDEVLEKFENVAPMLAKQYGAKVPVVGMGHSCGALLQVCD